MKWSLFQTDCSWLEFNELLFQWNILPFEQIGISDKQTISIQTKNEQFVFALDGISLCLSERFA